MVNGIKQYRQEIIDKARISANAKEYLLKPLDPPLFVWEPVPDSCKRSDFDSVLEAMHYVDVMSPNHLELAKLFEEGEDILGVCELGILQRQCNELLKRGFGEKPSAVIVRRGENGCYVASQSRHMWFPAYFRPKTTKRRNKQGKQGGKKERIGRMRQVKPNPKVIDPTGGGNAFLGGLCIGLLRPDTRCERYNNFEYGAIYGTVAASFVIQQVGMPTTSDSQPHADGSTTPCWNGETFQERFVTFIERMEVKKVKKIDVADVKRSQLYQNVPFFNPSTGVTGQRLERRPTKADLKTQGNDRIEKRAQKI